METIQKTHQMQPFESRLFDRYFGGRKLAVFDIETLGLNPSLAEIILAGFLEVSPDGSASVTQFFAENREDERELIDAVFEEMKKYDVLLTYNGKHFDLPFFMKRAEIAGFDQVHTSCHNLDLYLVLHGHSSLKQTVRSLKQKNVEEYMGIQKNRMDEISGAESIQLYEDYLAETLPKQKEELKQKILLHNHDDLMQLYRILPVLQQTDIHRAMSFLGFPVSGNGLWPQLNVGRIRVDHRGLTVTGTCGGPAISYTAYDNGMAPYSCSFTPDGSFEFLFSTRRHKNSQYLELSSLLDGEAIADMSRYPACVNGFLILTEGRQASFLEINMFVQHFLRKFTKEVPCPLHRI